MSKNRHPKGVLISNTHPLLLATLMAEPNRRTLITHFTNFLKQSKNLSHFDSTNIKQKTI